MHLVTRHGPWALLALFIGVSLSAEGCAKGTTCGNGTKDGDDECDGVDLGGASCASLGLGVGTLRCTPDCTFDTSACSQNAQCGNGRREGTEQCDGADLGGKTCALLNLASGTLACNPDCTFDTSGCTGQSQCGDGILEGTEQCDGQNLNNKSCATLGLGFTGGVLTCKPDCTFDTSQCTSSTQCGNGVIEAGEQCDGQNLAGATCQTLGFAGGNLRCDGTCHLDTSGCGNVAENCSNGIDDDRDSATDCDDLDCGSDPACQGQPENCSNGIDDDRDGVTDCDDSDCQGDPACPQGEICDNGTDDDGNFLCDCMDFLSCLVDCLLYPSTETNCSDGQDEDHDCLVDCNDDDCANDPACGGTPEVCDNGADDDGDGATDCDDSDCQGDPACPECVAAGTLGCGDSVTGNNSGQPSRFDSYQCADYDDTGPEIIYVFSRDTDGDATFILEPNSEDLDLSVTPSSNNDCDFGACKAGQTTGAESVTFHVQAGAQYFVIVDGYSGATDSFTLSVRCQ